MHPFKLNIETSYSEKDFAALVGDEKWTELKNSVHLKNSSNTCFGCGHIPATGTYLQVHLHYFDGINIDTSEFLLLCEGCHSLKHFDVAAENNWAVLVNSVYSQEELIRRNRSNGAIRSDIQAHRIVLIKKTPAEYLKEIQESELNRNDKTKVVFGNKFVWKK